MKGIDVQLLDELSKLYRKGVRITLEGYEVSPDRVIDEFCVMEETNYMRDYILDDDGKLIELGFYNIKSVDD